MIGGDDVADDTGDETPDPNDTETVPVDSIYDNPEIDPETGAFLVAPGQAVQGTGGDDLFTLVEGMDYSNDHDEDNSVTIAAGDGNDEIIFDGYAWGSINGGEDDDVIRADNWGGNINGGDGDDDIQISNGYGLFEGGAGNDLIVNGGDGAVLYGGDAMITLFTAHSSVTASNYSAGRAMTLLTVAKYQTLTCLVATVTTYYLLPRTGAKEQGIRGTHLAAKVMIASSMSPGRSVFMMILFRVLQVVQAAIALKLAFPKPVVFKTMMAQEVLGLSALWTLRLGSTPFRLKQQTPKTAHTSSLQPN